MRAFIKTNNDLKIIVKGKVYVFSKDVPAEAVYFDDFRNLLDETKTLDSWFADFKNPGLKYDETSGRLTTGNTYCGDEMSAYYKDLLKNDLGDNFKLFVENLYKNPNKDIVLDIFRFIQAGCMPITDDGHFLAYKKVCNDYMDIHSQSIYQGVGEVVSMPRSSCEFNRDITCSDGLHFCSEEYLPHFGYKGSKVIIVKINPADVVSIPSDYNLSKGRCCKFEVIQDVTDIFESYSFKESHSQLNESDSSYDEDEEYDDEDDYSYYDENEYDEYEDEDEDSENTSKAVNLDKLTWDIPVEYSVRRKVAEVRDEVERLLGEKVKLNKLDLRRDISFKVARTLRVRKFSDGYYWTMS